MNLIQICCGVGAARGASEEGGAWKGASAVMQHVSDQAGKGLHGRTPPWGEKGVY